MLEHVGAPGDERAVYPRAQQLRPDPAVAGGDHPSDDLLAQSRLEREQLAGGEPVQELSDADVAQLVRDAPEVVELRLLECGIQQRLVVELELDAPLGQPVERRPGERGRTLQRGQPAPVCRAGAAREELADPGEHRRRQRRTNPQRPRRVDEPAQRLADDPWAGDRDRERRGDPAGVSGRCAPAAAVALEQRDLAAAAGERLGDAQADRAAADHAHPHDATARSAITLTRTPPPPPPRPTARSPPGTGRSDRAGTGSCR